MKKLLLLLVLFLTTLINAQFTVTSIFPVNNSTNVPLENTIQLNYSPAS